MALNAKHRIFVREYLKDRDRERAYRAAYGETKGAAQAAHRLLKNVEIAKAVEKGLARIEAKLDISAERTLARIALFAYQPLNPKELKNSAGINSLRACEMLGKHFKLFTDLHEHTGKDGAPMAFVALPSNDSEAPGHPSPAAPDDTEETGS